MMDKSKWLAKAIHGTRREKAELEENLRWSAPEGSGWTRHDGFMNSIKGFRAELVAREYLNRRYEQTFADFRWTHVPDVVYEIGDELDSEPDGAIQSLSKDWFTMDVKSCRATPMLDVDGKAKVSFRNAHNAEIIVWVHDSTLTFCRRLSPVFTYSKRWDAADYEALGSVDVREIEEFVDLALKKLYN